MKILKKENLMLATHEIGAKNMRALANPIALKILQALSHESMYPKYLAKKLRIHEQKVYYYIHGLEQAGAIQVVKQERLQGIIAKWYAPVSESFFLRIKDFHESSKLDEPTSAFLHPFIEQGEMNSLIVVGSPDPHGPLKARSRDGYFGMDLALFLGTFLHSIKESAVRLDTEIRQTELQQNNLIVLGGPIVNKVAEQLGKRMPIYFDEEKKGFFSTVSEKLYVHEEIGVIVKCTNPWNNEKKILFIAGIRNAGTKAAILTFLKHFHDIERGNLHNRDILCKVVEGIDLNSDGIVDDVEILE